MAEIGFVSKNNIFTIKLKSPKKYLVRIWISLLFPISFALIIVIFVLMNTSQGHQPNTGLSILSGIGLFIHMMYIIDGHLYYIYEATFDKDNNAYSISYYYGNEKGIVRGKLSQLKVEKEKKSIQELHHMLSFTPKGEKEPLIVQRNVGKWTKSRLQDLELCLTGKNKEGRGLLGQSDENWGWDKPEVK